MFNFFIFQSFFCLILQTSSPIKYGAFQHVLWKLILLYIKLILHVSFLVIG